MTTNIELPEWCKNCSSVVDQCKLTCIYLWERVKIQANESLSNNEKPMITGTC